MFKTDQTLDILGHQPPHITVEYVQQTIAILYTAAIVSQIGHRTLLSAKGHQLIQRQCWCWRKLGELNFDHQDKHGSKITKID